VCVQLLSVEEALLSLYRDIIPIPLWFGITAMLCICPDTTTYVSSYYCMKVYRMRTHM
jgi:hypothetical protein